MTWPTCYKDFSILIDRRGFGAGRDAVSSALTREGVEHRAYYSPPVHRQDAYQDVTTPSLQVTDRLASQVISLPIWSHLPLADVDRVAGAISDIHSHAAKIERAHSSVTDRPT